MNHKVGDTVRIRSREWLEENGYSPFVQGMGGKISRIKSIEAICGVPSYCIDLDGGGALWEEKFFDPDYRSDEPLTPEEAIRAMLDGETLFDDEGNACYWSKDRPLGDATFCRRAPDGKVYPCFNRFQRLYRRPEKRKRLMTRWEVLAWTTSEESQGWVVKQLNDWESPQFFAYENYIAGYRRAKLLPDLSGIDESTIQGFEVEE